MEFWYETLGMRWPTFVLALVAVPALSFSCLKSWTDHQVSGRLPKWRKVLGAVSLVLTAYSWLFFLVWPFAFELGRKLAPWVGIASFSVGVHFLYQMSHVCIFSATLGSFLKGTARHKAVTAGFLCALLWVVNIVE